MRHPFGGAIPVLGIRDAGARLGKKKSGTAGIVEGRGQGMRIYQVKYQHRHGGRFLTCMVTADLGQALEAKQRCRRGWILAWEGGRVVEVSEVPPPTTDADQWYNPRDAAILGGDPSL